MGSMASGWHFRPACSHGNRRDPALPLPLPEAMPGSLGSIIGACDALTLITALSI